MVRSSHSRQHDASGRMESLKRETLRPLLYSPEDIAAWLAAKAFPFSKYDAELGYLNVDRDFKEGVDGAVCTYRYDRFGARRMFAHADMLCRINTYGNSFTSCEQVSDGETFQEVLASHLGEPIRNFGIGGYSVYQAYLRMKREEARSPAPYIIFNIYDDDHYRNLHSWQRIRFTVNRKSANPPVPHVKVDLETEELIECPNPCPTAESLYKLCDLDSAYAIFHDGYVLNQHLDRQLRRERGEEDTPSCDIDDPEYTRVALRTSMRIIEKAEEFAAAEKRTILYVLSFSADAVRRRIESGSRFDEAFVYFLERRGVPYVDLLEAHAADSALLGLDTDTYLERYFIGNYNVGHYNPLGYFFCASKVKDPVVRILDPPPPAYSPGALEF